MSLTVIIILALLPPLIAASAFCSASETALFGLSYNDRLQLRRLRPKSAAAAEALLASPRALLVTILISNMSVNSLIFALCSVLVLHVEHAALGAAINTASIVLLIVFGEVLPKLLAGSGRITFCRYLAPSVRHIFRVLTPVRTVVEFGVIGPLARLFRPEAAAQREGAVAGVGSSGSLGVKDLERLLELGATQGAIDREEQSLIAQVVQIGHRRVYDVMTPRREIRWLDRSAGTETALAIIRESGHRYLPVFVRSPDEQVVGLLDARRYVAAWAGGKPRPVETFVFPVTYIPENARLDQLLDHFRATQSEIALCVDEHGTIDGLVSVSDVAGRFVEEFGTNETDSPGTRQADGIEQIDERRWTVPGRLSVHDFAELFDLDTDTRASTVAGLITVSLGRIASPGDRVRLGNIELKVESIAGNMVERVEVSVVTAGNHPPPSAAGPDEVNGGGA